MTLATKTLPRPTQQSNRPLPRAMNTPPAINKHIFIFGNGNLSFHDFIRHYQTPIQQHLDARTAFLLCDFRGVDTLAMELLKCLTPNVTVYHIGERPRYKPDAFRTEVNHWKFIGGFTSDKERDLALIEACTHFIGLDFNSDSKRKSGTLTNIEHCRLRGKVDLTAL